MVGDYTINDIQNIILKPKYNIGDILYYTWGYNGKSTKLYEEEIIVNKIKNGIIYIKTMRYYSYVDKSITHTNSEGSIVLKNMNQRNREISKYPTYL